MKYEKLKEDKSLGNFMRFVDRYGNEIHGCIELDTDTGYAVVYEELNEQDPNSPIIKKEKYHPEGMCIIDGIANPDLNMFNAIRFAHHVKNPSGMSSDGMIELVRMIRHEVMPRMGLIIPESDQKQK